MKIIDLSQTISNLMSIYPGDPKTNIIKTHSIKDHNYAVSKLTIGSHSGTHVDAYSHMHEHMRPIDKIDLTKFYGEARCINDIDKLEKDIGILSLIELNISHLPKILKASPTFVGGSIDENLERTLLENGIITYTNLVNLDKLPINETFMFYGFPLKIKDGDGSPVRAVAIIK